MATAAAVPTGYVTTVTAGALSSPEPSLRNVAPLRPSLELADAANDFLIYLRDYRQASPLTVQSYRRDLTRLAGFLQGSRLPTTIQQITTRQLQAFAVSMSQLAPATITRSLNAVSSMFGYLVRCGLVERNPVEGVIKPPRRQQAPAVPSIEQCMRMAAGARTVRDRALLMVLLTTGLRRAELLDLCMADLAADLGTLRVTGKGGRQRAVPAPPQTQQALREYITQRGDADGPVLPNRAGRRIANTGLYRIFRRLLKRAGLADSGITPHSLRHAYATTLLHSAVDVKTVQELLGHADLTTTSRYLHSNADTKRRAAAALPVFLTTGDGAVS